MTRGDTDRVIDGRLISDSFQFLAVRDFHYSSLEEHAKGRSYVCHKWN
jgi:hypothetical protein